MVELLSSRHHQERNLLKAGIHSFVLSLILTAKLLAAPGEVDLTFDAGSGIDGVVHSVSFTADGKLMIGGAFDTTQNVGQSGVARLNGDGTSDLEFSSAGVIANPADRPVLTVVPMSEGKILVGGGFFLAESLREAICRLNADGSLDRSFVAPAIWGAGSRKQVRSILLQPDGNVLVGGTFAIRDGAPRDFLARLGPSGSLDESFTASSAFSITCMAQQADGKILIGGAGLRRLHSSGEMDTNFIPGLTGNFGAMAVQSDGKILVAPSVPASGFGRGLGRLNTNGSLDTNFLGGLNFNGSVNFIKILDDGKIVVGGSFTNIGTNFVGGLARLLTNGLIDTNFASTSRLGFKFVGIRSGEIDVEGRIVVGGTFPGSHPDHRFLSRFHSDGNLDTTFRASHGLGEPGMKALRLMLQSEDKFIGAITNLSGVQLRRFFLDGSPDPGFVSPILTGSITRMAFYTNGTFIGLRAFPGTNAAMRFELVQFSADGQVLSQGRIEADNVVNAISVQNDRKIIIGGRFQNIGGVGRDRVARVALNGGLDASFNVTALGQDALDPVYVVEALPDGKVFIGIGVSCTCSLTKFLVRVHSDGSIDNTFNIGSRGHIRGLKIQPDGKLLAYGIDFVGEFHSSPGVARYHADGRMDEEFKSAFTYNDFSAVVDIALDSKGRIVTLEPLRVSRLNTDGSLDETFPRLAFGPGPYSAGGQGGYDLLEQPDGNVLVSGQFGSIRGEARSTIARVFGEPIPIPLGVVNDGDGNGVLLNWSNSALSLQSAAEPEGPYVTIPDAKSPWRVPTASGSAFFRLSLE